MLFYELANHTVLVARPSPSHISFSDANFFLLTLSSRLLGSFASSLGWYLWGTIVYPITRGVGHRLGYVRTVEYGLFRSWVGALPRGRWIPVNKSIVRNIVLVHWIKAKKEEWSKEEERGRRRRREEEEG